MIHIKARTPGGLTILDNVIKGCLLCRPERVLGRARGRAPTGGGIGVTSCIAPGQIPGHPTWCLFQVGNQAETR